MSRRARSDSAREQPFMSPPWKLLRLFPHLGHLCTLEARPHLIRIQKLSAPLSPTCSTDSDHTAPRQLAMAASSGEPVTAGTRGLQVATLSSKRFHGLLSISTLQLLVHKSGNPHMLCTCISSTASARCSSDNGHIQVLKISCIPQGTKAPRLSCHSFANAKGTQSFL